MQYRGTPLSRILRGTLCIFRKRSRLCLDDEVLRRLTVVLGLLVRVLRGVIMAFAIYPFGDITDGCGLDRFRILMGKRDRNN